MGKKLKKLLRGVLMSKIYKEIINTCGECNGCIMIDKGYHECEYEGFEVNPDELHKDCPLDDE